LRPAQQLASNSALCRGDDAHAAIPSSFAPWTRKLTPPIVLKGGRVLETLADVRELMLSLPERHLGNGHWVYAGQLLMAAATDKGVSMHEVQQQLSIALKAEGLI
jgi:hypothetical protein